LSEVPVSSEYKPLAGKSIVLGLTSSSAVYRSLDLARSLLRLGASVDVAMTREAAKLISPILVEWAIGHKPYTKLSGAAEHIALANHSDLLVIAPATLRTLARIACGLTDELLPLLATAMLGLGKRVMAVPTMNIALYNSPQYRSVEAKLEEIGVYILKPLIEEGKAKFPPLEDLVHCVEAYANRGRDLAGYRILVTAGPTREYIDPVRVITNPSSGLMGVLIAREAACRGASVDLIHGPLAVKPPYMVERVYAETTSDMARAVAKRTNEVKYDAAIFAAAPADFAPVIKSPVKIPSRSSGELELVLRPTPKVVKHASKQNRPRILVIFVAETAGDHAELVEKARAKLEDYDADVVVANRVFSGVGFASNYIDACIVERDKHFCYGVVRKEALARIVVDAVAGKLSKPLS